MAVSPYAAAAQSTAQQFGIPPAIFSSLIGTESSWNPNAQASGSSAYGLGQMTTAALKDVGASAATNQTPQQQLNNSAAYLSKQYAATGSWTGALGAYNQGIGGANSAAGQSYASKVLAGAGMGSFSDNLNANASIGWSGAASSMDNTGTAEMQQTNASLGIGDWIQSHAGDISLVVLGIMVIGVALVASVHTKDIVLKTVGSAVL